MKSSATPTGTCGGALRYSVSAVLIVLLLGLLPAACCDPEGQAVSDATEEQPRGGDMSEPDGEGGHAEEGRTEDRRPPNL